MKRLFTLLFFVIFTYSVYEVLGQPSTPPIGVGAQPIVYPLPTNWGTSVDTYTTATSSGALVNTVRYPSRTYSIEVKSKGGVATAWTVVLEGSLDGVNFTPILTHSTADGDGTTKTTLANLFPMLFYHSRVTSLTLAPATSITVTIVGVL
jgi:hypothetical protein